jgi:hypothetical protein
MAAFLLFMERPLPRQGASDILGPAAAVAERGDRKAERGAADRRVDQARSAPRPSEALRPSGLRGGRTSWGRRRTVRPIAP